MFLAGKEIELHTRYKLGKKVAGTIIVDRRWLHNLLSDYVGYQISIEHLLDTVGTVLEEQYFVYDNEEYKGHLVDRIAKYCYLQQYPLSAGHKEILSRRIAAQTQSKNLVLEIEFADLIDWQPGEFQEDYGSCWWGDSYSVGKLGLMHWMQTGRAFAIKMWMDDGTTFGRCFGICVPEDYRNWQWQNPDVRPGDFVLFNFYTRSGYSYENFLVLFREFIGVQEKYTAFGFSVPDGSSYVNNDSGYLYSTGAGYSDIEIYIDDYKKPYNPIIEKLRFIDSVETTVCGHCNRHQRISRGIRIKPHMEYYCGSCIGELGIQILRYKPSTSMYSSIYTSRDAKTGEQFYYDARYYRYSDKKQKVFKKKGVTWPTQSTT